MLFASAAPVSRADLARVVGSAASVDLLIEDLAVELEGRAVEVARVADGWMLATRPAYAPAIRAAAALPDEGVALRENELTNLDGNGISINGYHRGLVVDGNDFSWIGDSASEWG